MPKKPKKQHMKKAAEYARFVLWCATPEFERNPKNQTELAKELNVDEGTLSDWRNVETFWEDIERQMKKWMKNKTPNVLAALYGGVLKDKKAAEAKLWLEYAHGFSSRSGLDDDTMEGVFKLERTLRDLFEKKRKKGTDKA